jgi:predicted dehydrogenase
LTRGLQIGFTAAMTEIKAAIIGTGAAARFHLLAFRKCAHVQVVAICGTNANRANAFGQEFGVRSYLSIEEMLRKERPDVVTVASLEWAHEQPVLQSLDAGCHVLCEKVMAHTLAIGERMVAAASRSRGTLGVNYNYRCVPSHGVIKSELARGAFGEPALFTSYVHSYLWAHMIDLMRFFFGDPVEVMAAVVDEQSKRPKATAGAGIQWMHAAEMIYHPSVAVSASFRFRKPDFVATLSGSVFVPYAQNFWSFGIFGTRGALSVTGATRDNLGGTADLGPLADRLKRMTPCSYPESFDLSVKAYVEALQQDKPPPVSGEDGLAAMRLEAAIVRSAREGRSVTLPG